MLATDIRYALRGLRQNPVFALAAVASLAIGIGANTAIFTLADQLLLRPLPVREPGRLVRLDLPGPKRGRSWGPARFSNPAFQDIQHAATTVETAAQFSGSASFAGADRNRVVTATLISGNWFDVLGAGVALGRPLSAVDNRALDGHPVAVLSHQFWVSEYGASPSVLNKTLLLNGQRLTIVGVAAAGFRGTDILNPPELYIPLSMQRLLMPDAARMGDRHLFFLQLFSRLNPGVTPDSAKRELDQIAVSLLAEEGKDMTFRDENTRTRFWGRRFSLTPASHGSMSNLEPVRLTLLLLGVLAFGVLLIASANVANLLLARSVARSKETAVRIALGASRRQLARQVGVESLLLALAGGAAGLLAANWTIHAIAALLRPEAGALPFSTEPDFRIFAFTAGIAFLAALLFGGVQAAALHAADVSPVIKGDGGSGARPAASRLRRALVVAQVALSVLLLAASALFLTTLHNLRTFHPGFDTERLVTFTVHPGMAGYATPAALQLVDRLTEDLSALPGVTAVAAAAEPVLAGSLAQFTVGVQGYERAPGEEMNPMVNEVTPGFFGALGIPLLQGREFSETDRAGSAPVAIVSDAFARKYFAGRSPVGQKIGIAGGESGFPITVIGVVRPIRHYDLRDTEHDRQVYFPSAAARTAGSRSFYLRTSAPLTALAPAIRTAVRRQDPAIAIESLRTMEEQIDSSLSLERLITVLCTAFGLVATLLAAIGLYGVMAFHVARRTREIGIRIALGARRADVGRLVVRESVLLTALGVAAGVPVAAGLGHLARGILFGIQAQDPAPYAGAALFLIAVGLAASLIPAWRATRTDPAVTLRTGA